MRTRYSIINMLFNIGGQFLTMLLSFINRMVFIRCLSAEYLGVNGLFTDVLSILNFAELGIGTAMVFSMYEPAARNDEQKLARLMNLYKWMYRAVAASVLLFGLVLLPFLPHQGWRRHRAYYPDLYDVCAFLCLLLSAEL